MFKALLIQDADQKEHLLFFPLHHLKVMVAHGEV